MIYLERGELLHNIIDWLVLVPAVAECRHEGEAAQAHGDCTSSPRVPEGTRCNEGLQSLHVQGAGRLCALHGFPHVGWPWRQEVALAVEAAHAPFGAGVAHADTDVALLGWYYLRAMPLRVRGVQAAGEVCPPGQSFLDSACARYTAPGVARASACLRVRVQVWLCDGHARCHEPEDADQVVPVAAAARCLRFSELWVDFLALLLGDAPSHPDEAVLDVERNHALRGCCAFLILQDHAPVGADCFKLAHCFFALSFCRCDEDEVVDVGQVMDSPPGECIGQGLGDLEPLVHTRPASEAHAGVYVIFALPLDPLQLPVFWAHWLGSICCFDVGFRHPALTRLGVAFLCGGRYLAGVPSRDDQP